LMWLSFAEESLFDLSFVLGRFAEFMGADGFDLALFVDGSISWKDIIGILCWNQSSNSVHVPFT